MVDFNAFKWAVGGAIYIAGATLYGTKFPEKFYPGKFDIFVSSNLPHLILMIILGSLPLTIPYNDCNCSSGPLQRNNWSVPFEITINMPNQSSL